MSLTLFLSVGSNQLLLESRNLSFAVFRVLGGCTELPSARKKRRQR